MDGGPSFGLHVGGGTNRGLKPLGDEGVKAGQRHPVDARMPSGLSQGLYPPMTENLCHLTAKSVTFFPAPSGGAFNLALTPGEENIARYSSVTAGLSWLAR